MSKHIDPVRWFEPFGQCGCGKPAVGTWRGPQNESYGMACRKCGYARVRKAERERALAAEREGRAP